MVVDFPAPLGPRKPNTSPGMISKLTLLTPRRTPNRLVRPSTTTTGVVTVDLLPGRGRQPPAFSS